MSVVWWSAFSTQNPSVLVSFSCQFQSCYFFDPLVRLLHQNSLRQCLFLSLLFLFFGLFSAFFTSKPSQSWFLSFFDSWSTFSAKTLPIFAFARFLGFEFTRYGTDVLAMSERELGTRHDPMDRVFPKVTGCTYQQWGASGDEEFHRALCIMPLNVLNEKIFIFLWFWWVYLWCEC